MNSKYRVAVIGGGPAGSSTALRLARSGFEVCLLEKTEFPREVLCGEFLSREVGAALRDLGLYEKFIALKPNRINSFRFINDDSTELDAGFSFESFAMKRSVFDNFLLEEAKHSGVEVMQPAEAKNIVKVNGKFIIEIKEEGKDNFLINADCVVAAYGKRNALDKRLGRDFTDQKSGLNGIKFHIDEKFIPGFTRNRIDIYSSRGIYCGLNAVSEKEITLCLLEDKKKSPGSPIDHLLRLYEQNKKFAAIFSNDFEPGNIQMQAYGAGNIYFGKRKLVNKGILMAGDAAGVIAPLAGDGIGMAMQTGKLINDIMCDERLHNFNLERIAEKYESKWSENFKKRLFTAGIIQKFILSSYFKNRVIGFARHFPPVLQYLLNNTRG